MYKWIHLIVFQNLPFSFVDQEENRANSKLKPMVWSLCAALPVLTGVLRYKAGKHYWTDVLVGYVVGAAIGVAVPYLHSVKLKFNR